MADQSRTNQYLASLLYYYQAACNNYKKITKETVATKKVSLVSRTNYVICQRNKNKNFPKSYGVIYPIRHT